MSDKPSLVQLKPPRSEELAQILEGYAAEARAGHITGYNGILLRPGGKYTSVGWQGEGADAFEEIGMLWTCLMETWKSTRLD
jgi:hypothetical protein